MLTTSHGWGISARAHVHTALLYLRNGLTDCVQSWYVGCASLSKCFPQVRGGVGHLCMCARAPPSPHLRIRVANCAKIWCVAGDPIVTRFTRVGGGVTAHSHVRLQFRCLGNRWNIEATPKTNLPISFALARSSPNMASYWFIECGFPVAKTICQSVAWFKRYKTLKSVTVGSVGSLKLRKSSYSARTRSAFGLARNL